MQNLQNLLKNVEKYVGGILFFSIVMLCFLQVLYRFVFQTSAGWIEEYEIFAFIWFVYLGSAACVAEDKHVCVEMLVNRYSPKVRLISDILCTLIWAVVCAVVFRESLEVVSLNLERGATTVLAGLPYWVGQLSVTVGMVLMMIHLVLRVPEIIKNFQNSMKEGGST